MWIKFKCECISYLCFYCERITQQSKFYVNANDECINFRGKYDYFGKWLRVDTNMKIPLHVKNIGLRKKEASYVTFETSSLVDKINVVKEF